MEDACIPLNWECDYQEEAHDTSGLKLSLLYSKLEMETIIACTNEEIARKIDEASYFKSLLTKTIRERDEFQLKCQILVSKNLVLQHEIQKIEAKLSSFVRAPRTSYIEDDHIVRVVSSLVSNVNSTKTQLTGQISLLSVPPPPSQSLTDVIDNVVLTKGLPEKGKFLHAIMESGPLLQTLLLVGHLPRWRNPPQPNSIKTPQVTIPSSFMRTHGYDFPQPPTP